MSYSIEQILQAKEPGDLFSGNPDTLKKEYRKILKFCHTDINRDLHAKEATDKVIKLFKIAEEMIQSKIWKRKNSIKFACKDGRSIEIQFLVEHQFELGKMYIANSVVIYLIKSFYRNFYLNYKKVVEGFSYANNKMEIEISKYLPVIFDQFETKEGELGIVIKKTSDLILLKDIKDYYKGSLDSRHVAWIISSLMNIVCYIDYLKMSHNAISFNNCFISPKFHSSSILGGWWYSVPIGKPLIGMSNTVYSIAPPIVKTNKKGNIMTDLECIRNIGKELLGEKRLDIAPKPMVEWLMKAHSGSAIQDYENWQNTLTKSYGKRKFIILELTSEDIYGNK